MSADGLHINRRGHAVVATELIRSLAHHLAKEADEADESEEAEAAEETAATALC